MITKTTTVYNYDRFDSKLVALNKKAHKAGLRPVQIGNVVKEKKTVRNEYGEPIEVFSHWAVELLIEDEIIRFPGGWQLVGVIDHKENLVKSVPGEFANYPLAGYVERGAVCDHCHTYRDRNETFVVVDENGVFIQVGRSCLGDLLGIDPERALGQVEVVKELGEEDEWLGERQVDGYHLRYFLSHAVCMIRTAGWRSRSTAKLEGVAATADITWSNIINQITKSKSQRTGEPLWIDPSKEDGEVADRVVAWLEGLQDRSLDTDYLINLAQIGRNGFVTRKSSGFAASAVVAYQKEVEEAEKAATRRQQLADEGKGFVGQIDQRIAFVGKLVKSAGFDSQWGCQFFHRFIDEAGNTLVWKTGTELDQDKTYKVTATVKSHEEYRGEPQTYITRAKVSLAA
jgi:hypothetical protein